MAFSRLTGHTLSSVQTLMGWNQIVQLQLYGSGAYEALRVTNFNMGSSQTGDAPDYVTGADDRTAWMKGPVTTEGSIEFPYTFSASGTISGIEMFQEGANLAQNPSRSFKVRSSATNDYIYGSDMVAFENCKFQTVEIKGDAEGAISCSGTIWGIADTTTNVSSGVGNSTRTEISNLGEPNGVDPAGTLPIVQIPMWDAVSISGAPDGMYIVGFSIQVENNLQRNYTMGTQNGASPYGLNASSISAGQRRVTGSLTWQSDASASLTAILGSGINGLTINIGTDNPAISTDTILTLDRCLWTAVPPTISAGDRITCESSFVALGSGTESGDFNALTIT